MNCIELTVEEKELLSRIDFAPTSPERHDPEHWNAVGEAALGLMKSLIARKAIPDVRSRYFTDPDFNVGGRGCSRAEIFGKSGTHGEAIFRHPHFLKYLHYFLYGPDLPPPVIEKFRRKIADMGLVTSSDIARRVLKTARQSSRGAQRRSRRRVLQAGSRLRSRTVRGAINP